MSVAFSRKQGFEIYQRVNDDDFTTLLTQYKNNQIPVRKLASGNADRSVAIIASDKRKYILKEDREREKRLEKKIANFIFGPFQSRLIRLMDRAVNEGCHVFQELYFVAEKNRFRTTQDVYAFYEYIEGTPLTEVENPEQYIPQIIECILELHRHGLASNDIHYGNFILTPDGTLRIIDISCKASVKVCQANDLLALRRKFGVNIKSSSRVYKIIRTKEALRRKIRALKHKK